MYLLVYSASFCQRENEVLGLSTDNTKSSKASVNHWQRQDEANLSVSLTTHLLKFCFINLFTDPRITFNFLCIRLPLGEESDLTSH